MKIKLEKINLNKDLTLNEEYKNVITSAEKGRYSYFDYSKEKIEEIAKMNINDIKWKDTAYLVQALFPQYLIYSGLFDSFLMFEIKNNVRKDPPKYFYRNLISYLNNNKEVKVNYLGDEIINLFEVNNIKYDTSWNILLNDKGDLML